MLASDASTSPQKRISPSRPDSATAIALEERQQPLIGELQHRTRNLIAVVRSMAEKTARRRADETAKRIRFLGYDGMFEIRFFMDIGVRTKGPCPAATSERHYLTAFDGLRTRILDVAKGVYASTRQNLIVLKLSDFK
ncbi:MULTISPECIES: DUF1488 family protein [unclassified Rhizobium]|uniref:DUF1488 family protein n=1 Tax=unclassified Rhizobium TaxID=2613769 RepID=UPI001FE17517|nr:MULTISPECIES: DUF1488 family protein [unclassified Rhizobium]MDF0664204.1 DUF1488 family protein [Rhizobium sp. BC49]